MSDKKNIVLPVATKVILDSIADGVFTVDKDWNITSFNRAAERITGIASEKAIGQKCFDVLRANICQNKCAIRRTLKTAEEIIDLPVNILDKEGKIIPISISTAVLKDEIGNIIGGVETFRDLSALEVLKKQISRQYSFEDIIRLMADNQEKEFGRLNLDFQTLWGRNLQLIDCQNVFCEVDKYSRVAHPQIIGYSHRTRIKQKYSDTGKKPIELYLPEKWNINHLIN